MSVPRIQYRSTNAAPTPTAPKSVATQLLLEAAILCVMQLADSVGRSSSTFILILFISFSLLIFLVFSYCR